MKLNDKITIEKFDTSKQTLNGFLGACWNSDYFKCWSKLKNINGSEYISAKTNNSESIVTFTVRYCNKTKDILTPGNTKNYRVNYNGFIYDIEYASDFNNSHRYIDLKCKVKA